MRYNEYMLTLIAIWCIWYTIKRTFNSLIYNDTFSLTYAVKSRNYDSIQDQWHVCGKSWQTLQWRHNERDGVSNHQPRDCLLNRLFRRRSKKTAKLRVAGLCAGNSPGTGEFPAQMASNAENVSMAPSWYGQYCFRLYPVTICMVYQKCCVASSHL